MSEQPDDRDMSGAAAAMVYFTGGSFAASTIAHFVSGVMEQTIQGDNAPVGP